MPRRPRLDLPGIPQHVVQRDNDRQPCFFADADRQRYLQDLREIVMREGCAVHAYVLMTNHVHLLMTPTGSGQVARVMPALGRRYVRYVNDRYHRTGTLWEGRYKSSLVDRDTHLLHCYRYIELNPVRAAMCTDPADYPWSSHGCNALGHDDPLIHPHPNYQRLGTTREQRCSAYRAITIETLSYEDVQAIRLHLQRQHALGSDRFRSATEAQLTRPAGPIKIGGPAKHRPIEKVHSDPGFGRRYNSPMKELSYTDHVVPKLSVDGVAFTTEAIAKLDYKQLAHPGSLLAKIYWDVIEVLTDMLDILEAPSVSSQVADRRHRAVLRHAEILMLRCTSLNDYLRKLLSTCAPNDAEKELNQCCAAIETRLGKNIKIPINKTKHDGFTLAPITLTNGVASVPGFVVYGPLPNGATGPLSFSGKHGAGTPEGYSLPLFMRRVLALIFEMTDLARDHLLKWGAITQSAETAKAHNPNDVRIEALPALLERLNALPHHGFQGEHTVRSPMFQVKEGTMTMQMTPTKRLRGTVQVEFQIPAVHAGSSFQMPYWDPQGSK